MSPFPRTATAPRLTRPRQTTDELPPHVTTPVAGFAGAGILALRGSLDGTVSALAGNFLLAFPLKFLVAYTIIYHYLGGMRHFLWDHAKIGNNADRTSLLELPKVELSSKILLGSSAALAFICALL